MSHNHMYNHQWRKARKRFLKEHPLCIMCHAHGKVTPATVVDHVVPHKGNLDVFWDESNWQALCATHHNSAKKRFENSGKVVGCGKSGEPIDPGHHWNKG